MTFGGWRPGLAQGLLWVVALLWLALLGWIHAGGRPGPADALEYRLLDLRHVLTGPRAPATGIVLVTIDDAALETLDRPRARLTQLVSNIADSGAAALAVDVLLAEPGLPEEDAALAAALARLPTTIAAAARYDTPPAPPRLIWPQPLFRDAAQAGLVNLSTDAGGTPRFAPLMIEAEGALTPALPLLAALAYSGAEARFQADALLLDGLRVPLDGGFTLPLRYIGPGGSFPRVSATRLLEGPAPEALAGRLVVLGYTAAATGDRFATPFDQDMPGMEILATAMSQLLGGETLRRDGTTRLWDMGHALLLTLLALAALHCWPLIRAVPVTLALLAGSFGLTTLAFAGGLWLSAALPLLACLPLALAAGTRRYVTERRGAVRSARAVASLRRFQSPALADRLERDPDYLAQPVARDLAVFFVDLTGFTALSQRLGPEGTRGMLAAFHRLTAQAIEAEGGSLLNYMGDGAMAVFGLDEAAEPAKIARAAHQASARLARALAMAAPEETGGVTLRCRMGLHFGPVTLSRLGADSHQQVTVTGDSVNLASRLMEVAKAEGAALAASDDCIRLQGAGDAPPAPRQVQVTLRGRDGAVTVHLWALADLLPAGSAAAG